ncbi:MAG: hypothetical protein OEZ32_05705 [Nitrospinota bacterium]|nr:hypothetical protein [Nitrospinota bacterium]
MKLQGRLRATLSLAILPLFLLFAMDLLLYAYVPGVYIWLANHAPSINEDDNLRQERGLLAYQGNKKIFVIGLSHAKYSLDPDIINPLIPKGYQVYNLAMGNANAMEWSMAAQKIASANPYLVIWYGESYVIYWTWGNEQLLRTYDWRVAIHTLDSSEIARNFEWHFLALVGQYNHIIRYRNSIRRVALSWGEGMMNSDEEAFALTGFHRFISRGRNEDIFGGAPPPPFPLNTSQVDGNKAAFARFAETLRDRGVKFVFLYAPTHSSFKASFIEPGIEGKFSRFLVNMAETYTFDIARINVEDIENQDFIFYDQFHPNGNAYKLFSRRFANFLSDYLQRLEER